MTQLELYNHTKNPLDNPATIERLIDIYSKTDINSSYYGNLVKPITPKNTGKYYHEDADEFFALLFNLWKQKAVTMTKEEFIDLYRRRKLDQDFVAMRNYLKTVPDVQTEAQANDILNGNTNNPEVNNALDKYKYSSLGETTGWNHICSKYVACKNESTPIIVHRLYLNVDSFDVYKLATLFTKKCIKNNVPYYFKFDRYASRADSFVIYSSDEYLTTYISFLREIKKEHPELVSRIGEPPLLTGNIDNWIGYGSEPLKDKNGKNRSFNNVRAKIIESSISTSTKRWVLNNYHMKVIRDGKKIDFENYLVSLAVENLLKKYLEKYTRTEARLKNQKASSMTVYQECGFTLQDLKSPRFKKYLSNIIKPNLNHLLLESYYGRESSINIPLKNGQATTFNNWNLEEILRHVSSRIKKADPNYANEIKQDILAKSAQEGIDPTKFCYDSHISERYQIEMANKLPNVLTPSNITSYIDKNLLGKTKLPGGQIVDTKVYLESIVFPFLPTNGVIILKDNRVLNVKQFIEECVLTECALKYNNNFIRYYAENVKNNIGEISLILQGTTKIIKPADITNYVNPKLLAMKVRLADNQEITYENFIKTYFADFISPYGTVILKTEEEIDAIDYIENYLPELVNKYAGNINRILFNSTRNNHGDITINERYTNGVKAKYLNQISTVLS